MTPTSTHGKPHTGGGDARGVYPFIQRQLDRIISPSTRQDLYAATLRFAQERPLFFAFLLSQFVFSFLPLVTFAVFALSLAALALGAAIIFSLFWMGVALLVLVPTLFLTSSIGLLVWVWAAGSFVVARRLWAFAAHSSSSAEHDYDAIWRDAKKGLSEGRETGEVDGEKGNGVAVKKEEAS